MTNPTVTVDDISPDKCPECGERLAVIQQRIYCPACALRDALRTDGTSMGPHSLDLSHSWEIPLGGSRPEASDDFGELTSGETFGDYRIVRRLGRGGMGIVYETDHLPTSRRVALKVMTHSWDDRAARARFLREGRLAASINHPNSVYVYGTEEINGRPVISMELVRGRTLGDCVKSDGPLSSKRAVDAVLQIIDGLDAANEAGVLHRDVKPNNCFVDEDGQVKIGDFGLSITTTGRMESDPLRPTMTEVTRAGTFLGTPAYASPEQLRGEPLDHRSDIYAVGVTLYYLLSGKVPFAAENMVQLLARVLDNAAPPLKAIAPNVPAELDAIVARCLRKSPGARFGGYNELRQALLPLGSHAPVAAPLGSRFLAGAIDFTLLSIAFLPLSAFSIFSQGQPVLASDPLRGVSTLLLSTLAIALQWLYFALSEWRFGKTFGKHLLGLRVTSDQSKPKLSAALTRSALFLLVPLIPLLIANSLGYWQTMKAGLSFPQALTMALLGWSRFLIGAAMFASARSRNGNASLYDLLTGTRVVVKLVSPSVHSSAITTSDSFNTRGAETVGPYHVLNTIGKTDSGKLLLGYDARLLRRVWIHRADASSELSVDTSSHEIARDIRRRTQLRWLGGSHASAGEKSNELVQSWDCYEALSGGPLSDIEPTSIDWQDAKRGLAELAIELNAMDASDQVSLEHCWITDAGQVKLLPFAVFPEPTAVGAGPMQAEVSVPVEPHHGSDATDTRLTTLQQITAILEKKFALVGGTSQSMSLSEQGDLNQLNAASSLSDASPIANELARRRSVQVQSRVAGMLAASFILPCFCIISLLATSVLYDRQEASMPEVRELADAMYLREHSNRGLGLSQLERRNVIVKHIRAEFEEVYRDTYRMSSLYGQTQLMRYRSTLDRIFATPRPTNDEATEAARLFEAIAAEQTLPRPLVNAFFSSESAIFWGALTWLQLIWFPSLITGLLFRGGALVRLFGLTFANRRGQPASGLRVFIRMVFSGLIPMAAFVVYGSFQSNRLSPVTHQQFVAAFLVLVACFAVVAYRSRQRLFSDRCAGTFVVAK
ncbi:protein kinase domain-containing protein [Aureliella helgolandensis]|uniref:Serine/threonine-protein kinase PknH n=1 Tax=Aureliella helgolandensis TaxID=2527968 RepID=A0A518GHD6_9BACT|nr:protein kinase [Aureliella helgolandensis]QDV27997.1 Serine/threonine-protein kinase PknH [Aureliella helgolandensis]